MWRKTMNQLTLTGTYKDEPLTIHATQVTPNVVTVIVLVGDPGQNASRPEHGEPERKRIYGGLSFCHPNDTFNLPEGIKQACRHALDIRQIGGSGWKAPGHQRRREIYRACRVAIKSNDVLPDLPSMVREFVSTAMKGYK